MECRVWSVECLLLQLLATHNQHCGMISLFLSMGILPVCILYGSARDKENCHTDKK